MRTFWVSLIGRFRDGIGLQIHHLNATVHRGITCPFDRKSYRTWIYISSGHDLLIIPDYYSIGITVWEYVTLIIHPVNQTWLLRNPKTVSCVSCKEKREDVKKGIKVDEWYLYVWLWIVWWEWLLNLIEFGMLYQIGLVWMTVWNATKWCLVFVFHLKCCQCLIWFNVDDHRAVWKCSNAVRLLRISCILLFVIGKVNEWF